MNIENYLRGGNLPVKHIPPGKPYDEAATLTEGYFFSAGIWYLVGKLGDRFSSEQTDMNVSMEEAIEFLYRLGVKGVSMHYPGEFSDEHADTIIAMLNERGMRTVSIGANTFSHPMFKFGGPSSSDPEARAAAMEILKRAHGHAIRVGNAFQNNWAGRDGFDGHFIYEPVVQWERTRDGYVELLLQGGGKCGVAIEFKPYDAPEQSVVKTAEEAILMGRDVQDEMVRRVGAAEAEKYKGKLGICIEDAHVYLSVRKVAEAVAKSIDAGMLFLRHENDCEGRIDNDRIFGTIHFFDALEASYIQLTKDWDARGGIHEPDIFPQKDDPLKAYIQSLNSILFYYALAGRIRDEIHNEPINAFYKGKGAAEVHDRLLRIIAQGIDYRPIDLSLADRFRKEMGIR